MEGLNVPKKRLMHCGKSRFVAEVGENVRAGQPIVMVEAAGKQWLSFNVREYYLGGLTVGKTVSVMRSGTGETIKSVATGRAGYWGS
jgi:HlyD family secretion protein